MFNHEESAGHKLIQKVVSQEKKETMEKVILKQLSHNKEITAKVLLYTV